MSARIGEDWLVEYDKMGEGERKQLVRCINGLLARTFLVADVVDEGTGGLRSNPDYRLVDRHFEWVEAYLAVGGWTLAKDRMLGVMHLSSEFEYNRLQLDGMTTLVLYTLRLLYDEEREKLSLRSTVALTVWDVVDRLQSFRAVDRRITDQAKHDAFRVLARHGIVSRISGKWHEADCRFVVLPSILLAVPSDAIGRIYSSLLESARDSDLTGAGGGSGFLDSEPESEVEAEADGVAGADGEDL
jgi:hypothetical protein